MSALATLAAALRAAAVILTIAYAAATVAVVAIRGWSPAMTEPLERLPLTLGVAMSSALCGGVLFGASAADAAGVAAVFACAALALQTASAVHERSGAAAPSARVMNA